MLWWYLLPARHFYSDWLLPYCAGLTKLMPNYWVLLPKNAIISILKLMQTQNMVFIVYYLPNPIGKKGKKKLLLDYSDLSSLGVPGVPWHTADHLTLFQPGGINHAHLITTGTPGFSDLRTAL